MMKPLVRLMALIAVATLGLLSVASAQIKVMAASPRFVVLMNKSAKTDLKITEKQQKDIDAILGSMIQGDRMMIGGDTDVDQLTKDIVKILDETQRKRLEELWTQFVGVFAIADEKTAKTLELTVEQKKKTEALIAKMGEEMQDIAMSMAGGGDHEEVRVEMTKVRNATAKKLEAVLTADQTKKLEALKGKKLEIKKTG